VLSRWVKFLKVLCCMSVLFTTAAHGAESKSREIVVIGAGLAGLTAAYRLHEQGASVHVYEARGRVGGRIFSAIACGHTVELGGHNITDGGAAENIRHLMDELGLETQSFRFNLDHLYFDGETFIPKKLLYPPVPDPDHLRMQLFAIAEKAQNMQEVLRTLFKEEDPLYQLLSVRLAGYEGASVENLSPLYVETLYHMLLGGVCAAHQNVDDTGRYMDFVSIQGGNSLLPERLAEKLKGRVHLNMPLVAVSQAADGVYLLTFQNGEKVKADILVLAMPCSVYEDITFDKEVIPEEQLEAIRSVHYGTNAKIIVSAVSIASDRVAIANSRMFAFSQEKSLILFYTGEAGRFSLDTLKSTYEKDWPMIEEGFGGVKLPSQQGVMARDESFASYEGPVGCSWPEDPYAKGSYSYIAPGQEILLTAIHQEQGEFTKTLFTPVGRTLYFAGEHASILADVPGTMEAACESGERVARMIARR